MSEYIVYNCTARGARYVAKDKPCEDASASCSEQGIHIAIVADGHGDKTCFRSNIGSEIACKIAKDSMLSFAVTLRDQGHEDRMLGRDAEKLVDQLFHTILGRWTEGVLQHLKENAPTEEEYESTGSANAAIYRAGRGLPHIYGTTLIAMLVTDRYALILHQGDGRCIVFHENGEVDQPVPWDPRCEGRNTASLCDDDVLAHWRYLIIDLKKDRIIGCYAASDGIEDSFETLEETNAYIGMLTSEYIGMGREAFLENLPEHFSLLSRKGSQDDVSLGCILDVEAAAAFVPKYKMVYDYYTAEGENRRANERLNSMKRKTEYLTKQLEDARLKWERSEQTQKESKSLLECLRAKIITAMQDAEQHTQENNEAKAAFEAAQKEYDEYMAIRAAFVEKAENSQRKMDELAEMIRSIPKAEKEAPESDESFFGEEAPVYVQPEETYAGFEEEQNPPVLDEPAEEMQHYPVSEPAAEKAQDNFAPENTEAESGADPFGDLAPPVEYGF